MDIFEKKIHFTKSVLKYEKKQGKLKIKNELVAGAFWCIK